MTDKTHDENGVEYSDVRERRLFNEAMARTAQRLEGVNTGLIDKGSELADLAELHGVLQRLSNNMDVLVMSKGYNFIVSVQKGHEVYALTAGDYNYEATGLKLDMTGWEVTPEPDQLKADDWNRLWKFYNAPLSGRVDNHPEILEVVVTKTAGGVIAYDWLESGRYPHNQYAYFAANHGPVQYWMTVEEFEQNAPEWHLEHVVKLSEEAIAAHKRLTLEAAGVAESVSDQPPSEEG
jgi:hypothetical protein